MVDDAELEHRLAAFRHEAATPVALITAALNALDRQHLGDPDAAELLDTALRQAQVLQRLLDQLRGVGAEELVLDPTRVDLAGLAGQVVADLRASILAGRHCRVDAPDGSVAVDGDTTLLRQVLTNLLDNAVKYTGDDTTIHVAVDRRDSEVELVVTDEGEGVAGQPTLMRATATSAHIAPRRWAGWRRSRRKRYDSAMTTTGYCEEITPTRDSRPSRVASRNIRFASMSSTPDSSTRPQAPRAGTGGVRRMARSTIAAPTDPTFAPTSGHAPESAGAASSSTKNSPNAAPEARPSATSRRARIGRTRPVAVGTDTTPGGGEAI